MSFGSPSVAERKLEAEELIRKATEHMRLRNLDEAEGLLLRADAIGPEGGGASACALQLGLLSLVRERPAEAEAYFARVDETEEPAVVRYRGVLAHCAGDYAGAMSCFRRALQADPHDAEALESLADCHRECGEHAAAEPLYRRAIAAAPGGSDASARLHYELGACLASQRDRSTEAVVELRKSLKDAGLGSGNVGTGAGVGSGANASAGAGGRLGAAVARLELGMALTSAGAHREALVHLQLAAEAAPHLAIVHHAMGAARAAVGAFTDARESFERALGICPDAVRTMRALAGVHAATGNHAAAAATLQQAIALVGEGDTELLQLLGDALAQNGQLQEAEELYVRALAEDPASADLARRLANVRFPVRASFALLVGPPDPSPETEEQDMEAWETARSIAQAATNDVESIRAALVDEGYDDEHVFVLTGAASTPTNILRMIDTLSKGPLAAPHTALLLYIATPVGLYASQLGAQHDKAFFALGDERMPVPRLMSALAACPAAKVMCVVDGAAAGNSGTECASTARAMQRHAASARNGFFVMTALPSQAHTPGSPLAAYLAAALRGSRACVRPAARFLEGGCFECRRMRAQVRRVGVTATDLLVTLEYHLGEHGLRECVCLDAVQLDQDHPQNYVIRGRPDVQGN